MALRHPPDALHAARTETHLRHRRNRNRDISVHNLPSLHPIHLLFRSVLRLRNQTRGVVRSGPEEAQRRVHEPDRVNGRENPARIETQGAESRGHRRRGVRGVASGGSVDGERRHGDRRG